MITEYFGNNLLAYPENKKEYDKIVLFIKNNNIQLRSGVNDIYSSALHNKTYFIIDIKFEDKFEDFFMEKTKVKRYKSQLKEKELTNNEMIDLIIGAVKRSAKASHKPFDGADLFFTLAFMSTDTLKKFGKEVRAF